MWALIRRLVLSTWLPPILLSTAWLFLFLVSITPQLAKGIYFLQIAVDASSSVLLSGMSDSIRFGVWGYCSSGLDASIFGTTHDSAGGCSPRHLGYQIDSEVAKALHVDSLANAISGFVSAALGFHVVGDVLAFIAIIIYFMPSRLKLMTCDKRRSRTSFVDLAFIVATGLAFCTTFLAFIFDLALVSHVRSTINKVGDSLVQVSWGSATWLTLAASVMLAAVLVLYRLNKERLKDLPDSALSWCPAKYAISH